MNFFTAIATCLWAFSTIALVYILYTSAGPFWSWLAFLLSTFIYLHQLHRANK